MNTDRSGHPSAVAVRRGASHRIYMFGGGYDGKETLDSCEFLDVGEDQWTLLKAKMSAPRTCACAVVLDHTTIVICGGSNSTIDSHLASCDSLDLNTNTFSPFPDMLEPRVGHAGVHYNGTVVVLGGGHDEKTCEQFDPAVSRWTPFAPLPKEDGYTEAVVIGDKIYAVTVSFGSLQIYDGAAWTVVVEIPRPFMFGPVVALGGKVVLVSSCGGAADVFDSATESWSSMDMNSQLRYEMVAISF